MTKSRKRSSVLILFLAMMGEEFGKTLASELRKTNGRKIKKITNTFDTIEVAMILRKQVLSND